MKPFSRPFLEGTLRGHTLLGVAIFGCAAGFLLFGFDQSLANALTGSVDFQQYFPALFDEGGEAFLGFAMASFVLGSAFGCLGTTFFGNRIGRRPLLIIASASTLFFGALQAGAVALAMFIVMRFLNGAAVGVLTSTVMPYIGELSKAKYRGRILASELVIGSAGLATAFWVAYGFRNNTTSIGWRIPVAIQAMLAVVSLVCLLFCPESPRYLASKGRVDEGRAVLACLYGDEYAAAAMEEIVEAVRLEEEVAVRGWFDCFQNNKQCFRYRTLLGLGVNFMQQASGVNIVTYYSGTILIQGVGMAPDKALLVLGGLGIAGHVATYIGCFGMIEKLGRVWTLIIGSILQCVAMCMLAGGQSHLEGAGSYVAITGIYLFLCAFSACWLLASWAYASEITPLATRQKANALSIGNQYLWNFVVVQITPYGFARIGAKFYIPFAILNALSAVALYIFYPEPANLSLEQIDALFWDGKVHVRRGPKAPLPAERQEALSQLAHTLDDSAKPQVEYKEHVDKESV